MSVTAKLDLACVFHLALHHVPATGEVIHIYVISEQDVIRNAISLAVFVDVFDRCVLLPLGIDGRVAGDWSGEIEFCVAVFGGKPADECVATMEREL